MGASNCAGLRKTGQTVERPNTSGIRGQISKVTLPPRFHLHYFALEVECKRWKMSTHETGSKNRYVFHPNNLQYIFTAAVAHIEYQHQCSSYNPGNVNALKSGFF